MNAIVSLLRNGRFDVMISRDKFVDERVEEIFTDTSWCCVLDADFWRKAYAMSLLFEGDWGRSIVVGLYGSVRDSTVDRKMNSTVQRTVKTWIFMLVAVPCRKDGAREGRMCLVS